MTDEWLQPASMSRSAARPNATAGAGKSDPGSTAVQDVAPNLDSTKLTPRVGGANAPLVSDGNAGITPALTPADSYRGPTTMDYMPPSRR